MTPKNLSRLYGFEDYTMINLQDYIWLSTSTYHMAYNSISTGKLCAINKDLKVKVMRVPNPICSCIDDIGYESSLYEDHKELLKTAKKVYVHPACHISRSLIAEKYKKSLNPYLADVVVVPSLEDNITTLFEAALFINHITKIIYNVHIYNSEESAPIISSLKENMKLGDVITASNIDASYYANVKKCCEGILDAEFLYYGELVEIPTCASHIFDLLTYKIPADKTVYENSIQETLGCESNQLTFDSLVAIHDMLESSDEDTVAAGLKSLSMMDWIHYANSVKLTMNSAGKSRWLYNSATGSTSVKYMLNTISNSSRRNRWPGDYDCDIYEQDYELFKQLKKHFDKLDDNTLMQNMTGCNFMLVDPDSVLRPHIKKA